MPRQRRAAGGRGRHGTAQPRSWPTRRAHRRRRDQRRHRSRGIRAWNGTKDWWHSPAAGDQPRSGSVNRISPRSRRPALRRCRAPQRTAGVHREFGRAGAWYAELTGTVEQVTSELKDAFHAEAQRTLCVLAAAVDLFKDAATSTSTPGVEREFEQLCGPVQREIWKDDFRGDAAKVAADLAVLRRLGTEADAAAARVSELARRPAASGMAT